MATASISAPPASSERWLFGPKRDLFLGCGVGYMAVLAMVIALGPTSQVWLPASLLTFLLMFTSTPHYGATLLRVYEHRESRRRYVVFAGWLTAALAVAFAAACYWHDLGSGLVTLYFNWSPWHYTGQNFGIALMFLHRRGVPVSPEAKRWLYASFILSFLLVSVKMNGGAAETPYQGLVPGSLGLGFGPTYRFMPAGIPATLQQFLLVGLLAAYVVAIVGAFKKLHIAGGARDLIPTALVMSSQLLWFIVPTMFRTFNVMGDSVAFSSQHYTYAFLLVAIGHAVQYLWITAYYAKREPTQKSTPKYLAQCLLASCIIWYVPALIFAPPSLGVIAYGEGLALLIAATVNIHHFILDGAIWKLRDGRVANILLRNHEEEPTAIVPGSSRRWVRPVVWAVGIACFAVGIIGDWEREFGVNPRVTDKNFPRLETAVQRLVLIGQDNSAMHRKLGVAASRRKNTDQALAEFEASLELKQHPKAWFEIGHIHAKREAWTDAVAAYEAAYLLDPYPKKLIGRLAWALERTGNFDRANNVLSQGLAIHKAAPLLERQLRNLEQHSRAQ